MPSFGRLCLPQGSRRPSPSTALTSLPVSCSNSCGEAVSVHRTPVWLDQRQNEVSANSCRPLSRLPLTCSCQRPSMARLLRHPQCDAEGFNRTSAICSFQRVAAHLPKRTTTEEPTPELQ